MLSCGAVRGERVQIPHLADEQPDVRMTTWCSGWNATSNSLGRTSKPHVSVASQRSHCHAANPRS